MPDDEDSPAASESSRESAHNREFLTTLLEQLRRTRGNQRFIEKVDQALSGQPLSPPDDPPVDPPNAPEPERD